MINLRLFKFYIFFIFFCLYNGSAFAQDYETIKVLIADESDKIEYLNIRLNKKGIVGPNTTIAESIMSIKYKDPIFRDFPGPHEVGKTNYTFSGRTGDKTFEVRYIHFDEIDKISMFFEENEIVPLDLFVMFAPSCTRGDKISMKMLKLKGNQLEYEFIIPDCLKKYLPEENIKTSPNAIDSGKESL